MYTYTGYSFDRRRVLGNGLEARKSLLNKNIVGRLDSLPFTLSQKNAETEDLGY